MEERPVFMVGLPPHSGVEYELLMRNGQRRTAKVLPHLDAHSLFFTDCTHPEQNAYCNIERVKAWRAKPTPT